MIFKKPIALCICVLLITACAVFQSCSSLNKTQKGTELGSAAGGAIGALIGKKAGNPAIGATIGAALGGSTGAFIGNKLTRVPDSLGKKEKSIAPNVVPSIAVTTTASIAPEDPKILSGEPVKTIIGNIPR